MIAVRNLCQKFKGRNPIALLNKSLFSSVPSIVNSHNEFDPLVRSKTYYQYLQF